MHLASSGCSLHLPWPLVILVLIHCLSSKYLRMDCTSGSRIPGRSLLIKGNHSIKCANPSRLEPALFITRTPDLCTDQWFIHRAPVFSPSWITLTFWVRQSIHFFKYFGRLCSQLCYVFLKLGAFFHVLLSYHCQLMRNPIRETLRSFFLLYALSIYIGHTPNLHHLDQS